MSLNRVEVFSDRGPSQVLYLNNPTQSYCITDIVGLDPVKADIVTSKFGSVDGDQFQAARRESRNIVITVEFNPDYATTSTRSLRVALQTLMMPKDPVRLRFYMDDGLIVDIEGRVETFSSTPFAKDPEAVISIICPLPDFYETQTRSFSGFTGPEPTEQVLLYNGNISTGFVFKLFPNRVLTDFTLFRRGANSVVESIDFTGSLVTNDVLTISTVVGDKYAIRTRSNVPESVLYAINRNSTYFPLVPGNNYMRVQASGAPIPYTIEYVNKFGGL